MLVPGLTDDLDDVARSRRSRRALGNVERVDVLPFHQMGEFKWAQLGKAYTIGDLEPPTRDIIDQACAAFRTEGLKTY